jgi:predicted nucleic acid-binding protein
MQINHMVLNASPLICLFKSGLHDLLPALFQNILIPEAVKNEVTAKGNLDFGIQEVFSKK